jgi:hypothetical protein
MHAATFASQSRSAGVGLKQQLVGQVLNAWDAQTWVSRCRGFVLVEEAAEQVAPPDGCG